MSEQEEIRLQAVGCFKGKIEIGETDIRFLSSAGWAEPTKSPGHCQSAVGWPGRIGKYRLFIKEIVAVTQESQSHTPRLDRIEAALDRMTQFQEAEAKEWRNALKKENAEWKAGIEDTIQLVSQGQTELGNKIDSLGDRLESKFDQLIAALTGLNLRN